LKSLDEIVAAKPTAAYDARWGEKGMQMLWPAIFDGVAENSLGAESDTAEESASEPPIFVDRMITGTAG
jgi:hypothetical protein